MSLPAYIYARYSSLEQGSGTTLVRQFDNCRKFVSENKWLHSPDREFSDEGRSAFSGDNRKPGAKFFDFEQRAIAGEFQNGAVLVIDTFCRLTRQGYETALELIRLLTKNGVSIGVEY